jgi:hypothetical protein
MKVEARNVIPEFESSLINNNLLLTLLSKLYTVDWEIIAETVFAELNFAIISYNLPVFQKTCHHLTDSHLV